MSTRVMKKFESVADGIDNMLAAAKYDYTLSNTNEQMKEEFANSFMIKQGQKYIKIGKKSSYSGKMGSVWGFVVNTDDDVKFKKGDVLKPAGFNAPARNSARGNVLEGGFSINWTGPQYLI
jgi:hypothetical protein